MNSGEQRPKLACCEQPWDHRGVHRGALLFLGVLLALAGSVAQAGAAPPATGTVFHTVDLKSNSIISVTVTCPAGYVAVSGGLSVGNLMVTGPSGPVLSSVPSGPAAWTFRLGNPVTSPDQTVVLAVRCVRRGAFKLTVVPAGSARALVLRRTTVSKSVTIAPGQQAPVKLSCPSGSDLTGIGYDERAAAGGKAVRATTAVSILPIHPFAEAVITNKADWAVGTDVDFDYPASPTSAAVPARATVQATCVRTKYEFRVGAHLYSLRFHTFDRQGGRAVPPGSQVSSVLRCPHGSEYVGTDFLTTPAVRVLAGPERDGRGAAFTFFNPSSLEATAAPSSLCAVAKYSG